MNFRDKFFYRFQLLNVAEKLIALNVFFFVLPLLVNTFLFLFKILLIHILSGLSYHLLVN